MTELGSSADWTRIYSVASSLDGDGNAVASSKGGDAAAAAAEFAGAKEWASLMTGCSHDHAAERRVFEMPRSSQLACCAVYRRTGNMYFSEGAYDRALERYQRALTYYEYAFADDAGQQLALHRVRLSCLLNAASCHLRLRRPEDAISMLTQALSLLSEAEADICQAQSRASQRAGGGPAATAAISGGLASPPAHVETSDIAAVRALASERAFCGRSRVKALLRRAVAHFQLQDFDAARSECDAAEAALHAVPLDSAPDAAPGGAFPTVTETGSRSSAAAAVDELRASDGGVPVGRASSMAEGTPSFAAADDGLLAIAAHDANDADVDVNVRTSHGGSHAAVERCVSVGAPMSGARRPIDDVAARFCGAATKEIAVMRAAIAEAVANHEAELRAVATAMFKSR